MAILLSRSLQTAITTRESLYASKQALREDELVVFLAEAGHHDGEDVDDGGRRDDDAAIAIEQRAAKQAADEDEEELQRADPCDAGVAVVLELHRISSHFQGFSADKPKRIDVAKRAEHGPGMACRHRPGAKAALREVERSSLFETAVGRDLLGVCRHSGGAFAVKQPSWLTGMGVSVRFRSHGSLVLKNARVDKLVKTPDEDARRRFLGLISFPGYRSIRGNWTFQDVRRGLQNPVTGIEYRIKIATEPNAIFKSGPWYVLKQAEDSLLHASWAVIITIIVFSIRLSVFCVCEEAGRWTQGLLQVHERQALLRRKSVGTQFASDRETPWHDNEMSSQSRVFVIARPPDLAKRIPDIRSATTST
ncbi:hypothetical protein T310_1996 [Rasamsonia emersonii CBS 393.64]|uniref:Uncharacterized protein n=1 Tax=Rasamsonia emersonii (strain ATCC 16479 / CBS 393.64 / IMI 116815) TaxID=1408163 RepID=A0A0F4Z0R7_RASE3|nr:hypothetical protein T310_1996 [Rasamsonia emersonii CBS 393.64]KKA23955.1 hypothetical protein T310_1996 [Rasamsonia emersonii CBS 393.64]